MLVALGCEEAVGVPVLPAAAGVDGRTEVASVDLLDGAGAVELESSELGLVIELVPSLETTIDPHVPLISP